MWEQFFRYLWNLADFQLGRSYYLNQNVTTLISQALPKTLVLVGISTLFAVVVAIPLGVYQVVRRNKPEDYIITGVTFVLYAMPAFLLGTLLILWFGIDIKLFPTEAPQSTSALGILSDPTRSCCPS